MAERNPSRSGFSLVEILVTVAIMGLMLTAVTQMLTSVRFSRDIIHNEQEEYLAGPTILDQIERDLRGICVAGLPLHSQLRIRNRVVGGADADRIDFITTTDSLVWREDGDRRIRADVNEVGYCLRPNPNDEDFLELYRREGFGVDDQPFDEGRYTFLSDRVRTFNIEIFPQRGPEDDLEPLEEWGVDESDPDTQGLPAFLRITLEIELEPRLLRETMLLSKQLKTYVRVINLPENLRFASDGEVPRLSIPKPPSSQGEDGGAGAGEEDGLNPSGSGEGGEGSKDDGAISGGRVDTGDGG